MYRNDYWPFEVEAINSVAVQGLSFMIRDTTLDHEVEVWTKPGMWQDIGDWTLVATETFSFPALSGAQVTMTFPEPVQVDSSATQAFEIWSSGIFILGPSADDPLASDANINVLQPELGLDFPVSFWGSVIYSVPEQEHDEPTLSPTTAFPSKPPSTTMSPTVPPTSSKSPSTFIAAKSGKQSKTTKSTKSSKSSKKAAQAQAQAGMFSYLGSMSYSSSSMSYSMSYGSSNFFGD